VFSFGNSADQDPLGDGLGDEDDGDGTSDTMGAPYHMSQADFQKQANDMNVSVRTRTQKKAAASFEKKVAKADEKPYHSKKEQTSGSNSKSTKAQEVKSGMQKEEQKLKKLKLEAQSVSKAQSKREAKAMAEAKKVEQQQKHPDLMESNSILTQHSIYRGPDDFAEDTANQGMVEVDTDHDKRIHKMKKEAKIIAKKTQALEKKGNVLEKKNVVKMIDPWDPQEQSVLLEEGEHAGEQNKYSRMFEAQLTHLEEIAKQDSRSLDNPMPQPLSASAEHRLAVKTGARNAAFDQQLKEVEHLAEAGTLASRAESLVQDNAGQLDSRLKSAKAAAAKAKRSLLDDVTKQRKLRKQAASLAKDISQQKLQLRQARQSVARLEEDQKISSMSSGIIKRLERGSAHDYRSVAIHSAEPA